MMNKKNDRITFSDLALVVRSAFHPMETAGYPDRGALPIRLDHPLFHFFFLGFFLGFFLVGFFFPCP